MYMYICQARLLSDLTQDIYDVVQFYLWFKFYFPFFKLLCPEIKENKI